MARRCPQSLALALVLGLTFQASDAQADTRNPFLNSLIGSEAAEKPAQHDLRRKWGHDRHASQWYRDYKTRRAYERALAGGRCTRRYGYQGTVTFGNGKITFGRYANDLVCAPSYRAPERRRTTRPALTVTSPVFGHSQGPVEVPNVNLSGPSHTDDGGARPNYFFGQ